VMPSMNSGTGSSQQQHMICGCSREAR